MSTMIQIRHVPDEIHRRLKARAAEAGVSLSDYLLQHLRDLATRPTVDELRARIAARPTVRLRTSTAEAVRAERDSH